MDGKALLVWLAMSFLAFLLFTFLKNSFAVGNGTHSNSSGRWNASRKPLVGGLGFLIALAVGWIVQLFNSSQTTVDWLWPIGSLVTFATGWIDDLRSLKPAQKLVGQCIAAILLLTSGTDLLCESPAIDFMLKFILIVGVMNSLNMLDNMDGVATIAALVVAVWWMATGGGWVAATMTSALTGFLLHNRYPSTIYMGDSGSLLLGYVIAGVILHSGLPSGEPILGVYPVVPILLFGLFALPLADSLVAVINRLSNRVSPFRGGKDHSTHHLVYSRMSEGGVTRLFLAIAAANLGLSLWFAECWITNPETKSNTWIIFAILVFFVLLFAVFWTISRRNLQKHRFIYLK